jgi:hypothetical protein
MFKCMIVTVILSCSALQATAATTSQAVWPLEIPIIGTDDAIYVELVPLVHPNLGKCYHRLNDAVRCSRLMSARRPSVAVPRYGDWQNYQNFEIEPIPGDAAEINRKYLSLPNPGIWAVAEAENGSIKAWAPRAAGQKGLLSVYKFSSFEQFRAISRITNPHNKVKYETTIPDGIEEYTLTPNETDQVLSEVLRDGKTQATVRHPDLPLELLYVQRADKSLTILWLPTNDANLAEKAFGSEWATKGDFNAYQVPKAEKWKYDVLRSVAFMPRNVAGVDENEKQRKLAGQSIELHGNKAPVATFVGWKSQPEKSHFWTIKNRFQKRLAPLGPSLDVPISPEERKAELKIAVEEFGFEVSSYVRTEEDGELDPVLLINTGRATLYPPTLVVGVPQNHAAQIGLKDISLRFRHIPRSTVYFLEDELTLEQFLALAAWASAEPDFPSPASWLDEKVFNQGADRLDVVQNQIKIATTLRNLTPDSQDMMRLRQYSVLLNLLRSKASNADESATLQSKRDFQQIISLICQRRLQFLEKFAASQFTINDDMSKWVAVHIGVSGELDQLSESQEVERLVARFKMARKHLTQENRGLPFGADATNYPVTLVTADEASAIFEILAKKLGPLSISGFPSAAEWTLAATDAVPPKGWAPPIGAYTYWPTQMLGKKGLRGSKNAGIWDENTNRILNLYGNVAEIVQLSSAEPPSETPKYAIMGSSYRTNLPVDQYVPVNRNIPLEFVGLRPIIRDGKLSLSKTEPKPNQTTIPRDTDMVWKDLWGEKKSALGNPMFRDQQTWVKHYFGSHDFWLVEYLRQTVWGVNGYSAEWADQAPNEKFVDETLKRIRGHR